MHKLFIISTDPTILKWKTLDAKVTAITEALNRTQNGQWEVRILQSESIRPTVTDGRITHAWFNTLSYPLFRAGYHHVVLHMSMGQWHDLGLEAGNRGANQIDTDFVGESYVRADEDTVRNRVTTKQLRAIQEERAEEWYETGAFKTYKEALARARAAITKENVEGQFIQTILHEMSHELSRATGTPDLTHSYHDKYPDISVIFPRYDMTKWQPVYQTGQSLIALLLQKLSMLQARPVTRFHPVQYKPRIISQAYGVKNSRYKRTGYHTGTDYAIPLNTPLHAPAQGNVTTAGTEPSLGHYCHFTYTFQGEVFEERWCHLSRVPKLGAYGRGAIVAYSGNTGDSTGPHLHREVHRDDVRIDLITKSNWATRTVDPEALIY